MASSIKETLRQWEEENPSKGPLGRVTEVNLSFRKPPIQKLDATLSLLTSVETLSISSNNVEKITGIDGLKNLKILCLSRNNIRDLNGIEAVSETLQQLWISYNQIEKLKVLTQLPRLKCLYIAHNLIKSWQEIQQLQNLSQLEDVSFLGNPLTEVMEEEKYQTEVAKRLPQVKTIDGETVFRN